MLKANLKKIRELPPKLVNERGIPRFDFEELPTAYLSDNVKSKALRKQLIRREFNTSECNVTDLQENFFSKENIDLINKQLIMSVFNNTNKEFLIGPQKEEDLMIVMRYVFIEYGRYLPYEIAKQIKDLNCRVVSEILPVVISNVDQKIGYLKDIETIQVGPPLPINTKNLERTLPSVSNIIHMN
jgi:hypothetical protein